MGNELARAGSANREKAALVVSAARVRKKSRRVRWEENIAEPGLPLLFRRIFCLRVHALEFGLKMRGKRGVVNDEQVFIIGLVRVR